jgi:hypothetical protein
MADLITKADMDAFFLNATQRAALHVVSPHLQSLEQQGAELRQRLAQEARRRLDQEVAVAVPDFRDIDVNPRWHRFLVEVDPFTGRVRQALLNEAVKSGEARRVIAFFQKFLHEQQAADQASSPGRPRRAPEKRTYTRAEIGQLYEQHRKGAEAEWARLESDIFAAQHENRIQGTPYLTK